MPHGKRVAFCNSSYKNEFDNGASVWGFYAKGSSFASRNGNDKNNSIVHVRRYMNASYGSIEDSCNWADYSTNCVYDGASYYPINCDRGFYGTQYACMNIPVFNTIEDTGLFVNEIRDPVPDNKAPAEEPEPEEKVGADAFYWDSLKCRISQQGRRTVLFMIIPIVCRIWWHIRKNIQYIRIIAGYKLSFWLAVSI